MVKHLVRAAVVLAAVLVLALVGGTWAASAQGSLSCQLYYATVFNPDDPQAQIYTQYFSSFTDSSGNYFQPCGFFETQFCSRVVVPLEKTSCQGTNLTIVCITSDGKLATNTVNHIEIPSDGMSIAFESTQDGSCGVFYGSPGIMPGVIYGG